MKVITCLKLLISLTFLSFAALFCQAETQKQLFEASTIKSFFVEGIEIQASFKYKKSLKIEVVASPSLSIKIKNGQLEIKDRQYQTSRYWKTNSKKQIVKIVGPSKPLKMFASQAQLEFSNWKSDTFVSARKAQIKDQGRKGSLKIFIREGSLISNKHTKGEIYLKGFLVKASVRNFADIKTHFYFNEGSLKLHKGSGDLSFVTDKAPVQIYSFSGNIKGRSKSSNIRASVKATESIEVFSKKGTLSFYSISTGARLLAYSESGKVYVPKNMHKKYSGKSTKAVGRLRGRKQQARVSLKTDTGIISVN